MDKLGSLRSHLLAAVPGLSAEPDRLQVFADAGRVRSTAAPGLSFEYAFTANVLLTDYSGHADVVVVALLAWLQTHQPDLLQSYESLSGIRFEADILDRDQVDLSIEIDLTESVGVHPRPDGGLEITHYPEPPMAEGAYQAERWRLFLRGEVVAEWSSRPGRD